MIHRFVAVSLSLALVVGIASGCTPEPAPTPSATGFASEEEAFAAAEETYRAYVDALNQVDLSDPETFEAVYAWTTGELNAEDRKNFSLWHANGYTKSGEAVVKSTEFAAARRLSGPDTEVNLGACYDVSQVDVTDADGDSLVDADRPDLQKLSIDVVSAATPTGLAVSQIAPLEGEISC